MKLELKENMYVRTKNGYISQYKYYDTKNGTKLLCMPLKNGAFANIEDIKDASFNIIDLIEVGDYVNGYYVSKIWEKDEITHYVDGTPIKRKQREIVIQAPNYGGIEILKNKNIKSIVTKKQFEQMSYKAGK